MKVTGIVRKIDGLGRIVLPIELRKMLHLSFGDALEIFVEDDNIILKKYEPFCIFCGGSQQLTAYEGKNVCAHCAAALGAGATEKARRDTGQLGKK